MCLSWEAVCDLQAKEGKHGEPRSLDSEARSFGEWALGLEQNELPAPSTWDAGEVGREPGRGTGSGVGQWWRQALWEQVWLRLRELERP